MVSFTPVSTPSYSPAQNREQLAYKEQAQAARERLQSTKPQGSEIAKTDAKAEQNFRRDVVFADARATSESSIPQGNRRGSLLDLSV